jgi:phage I-like protein
MTFASIKVELAADSPEAKWQKLFPIGVEKHRADFKITFDAKTLKSMADNYAAEGKPRRAVNYFHQGPSNVVAPLDNKIAAGWIQDVELRADGLYGLIQWTERARKYILADEMSYLSPEFRMSQMNKATGKEQGPTLLGAALLNDPFLTELPRVAASEDAPSAQEAKHMKKLIELLKLAEGASEADVEKAVEALVQNEVKLSEGETKLSELQTVVTKLTEQVAEVTKARDSITQERDALVAGKKQDEVKAFVQKLVESGKVTPAIRQNVEALGLSGGLEAIQFFEKATPVVAVNEEKGVTGAATSATPKEEAIKKVNARIAELDAKQVHFNEQLKIIKAEMPEAYALAYSAQ